MLIAWSMVPCLLCSPTSEAAPADAVAQLPLQGFYRPGRFMPVEVAAAVEARLEARGAIPASVDPQLRPTVVPLLMLNDEAGALACNGRQLPLHPLADEQALVACTSTEGPMARIASTAIPGKQPVWIPLDPSPLLGKGPPAAWESLDALVLDGSQMQRIDNAHRSALIASGATLVSIGAAPPDDAWPWRELRATPDAEPSSPNQRLWVLRHIPAGPTDCVCGDSAYLPTLGWHPSWPTALRWQIAAAGALLAIAAVAATQLRRRWNLLALAGFCLIATLAIGRWRRATGPVARAGGDVLVIDAAEQLGQRDAWLYHRARSDGQDVIPWNGATHPMLSDIDQATRCGLQIQVQADGQLQFCYRAMAGTTLAFLHRDILPAVAPRAVGASVGTSSPLSELSRQWYLSPGSRVIGQAPPAVHDRWPTVAIVRGEDSARFPVSR